MPDPENELLALLPSRDRLRLLAVSEPIDLELGAVLCEPGEPTTHVYLPVASVISLVARVDAHPGVEVGMVGREGMLGVQLGLGMPIEPLRAVVQGAGKAWRITTPDFRRQLAASVALRHLLDRYVYVLMQQLASAAACQRFHQIAERLARWLLMTQDRAQSDHFHVTHEFLAYMLGVRRVGVTQAAGALQRAGLLSYHRGEVRVIDRDGLEAVACSCYATDRRQYALGMVDSAAAAERRSRPPARRSAEPLRHARGSLFHHSKERP